jgi:hypothetical protein
VWEARSTAPMIQEGKSEPGFYAQKITHFDFFHEISEQTLTSSPVVPDYFQSDEVK